MAQDDLLKAKIKRGTFYLSSKEDEGNKWTKQEFKNPQNSEETLVRYHKELSLKGEIQWLGLREDKYAGEVLGLIIKGEDGNSYALQIPVEDTGGSVNTTNDYFNSIAGVMMKVKKGDCITMFVNNKNKDKQDRLYRNIVVLDQDGKLIKSDFSFKDVPRWTSSVEKDFKGKEVTKWNADEANTFFYNKAVEAVETFGNKTKEEKEADNKAYEESKNSSETATPKSEESKPKDVTPSEPDDYDDLPFN